jgi:outer membrane biosynthesis protein TonB
VQNLEPYEVHPHVGEDSRDTSALIASLVVHVLVILLVMLRPQTATNPASQDPIETGQPVALDPAVEFQRDRNAPPPPPAPQPIPEEPVLLGPNSDRPDDPPREEGPEQPPPEDENPANLPTNDPPPQPDPNQRQDDQRIPSPADLAASGRVLGSPTSPFPARASGAEGPPPQGSAQAASSAVGAMGRTGPSNTDRRGWRQSFPEAAGRCVEIPDLGVNPDGSPVLASVIGVVLDQAGRPLGGAHLQIMGAPFATFSDGAGNYRLEFDPKLLEKCRSQVVRVVAAGYRDQTLNLGIGRQVTSDDVVMRRR